MRRLILILSIIIALLSGCTVKQGQLVVIENESPNEIRQDKSVYEHLNVESRIFPIEKYKEAIGKIEAGMIPLAVSPDYSMVVAYQPTGSPVPDITNRRVVIGNMVQEINLYICSTENGESKSLGKFLSLKDFHFDETGNSLAFIDGNSNIYIYSGITGQLQKLVTAEKRDAYNTLSWSKDSKSLMINTRMEFDIASREFISIAVNSYTPFIRRVYRQQLHCADEKQ